MNVDIINLVFKIPRSCLSPREKMLLLAVAESIPTFGSNGKIFALGEKVREPEKKRIGKGGILEHEGILVQNYETMFKRTTSDDMDNGIYHVDEINPVMRLNDMLMNEDNLSISVLSKKTGYSQTAIREAKHSLINKGYLDYIEEGNKQFWIVRASVLSVKCKGMETKQKHYPKRARPKTAAWNKKQADERKKKREAEEAEKRRAEAEAEERRKEEIRWARSFKIPVEEFRRMLRDGEAYRDEDGDYHID